MMLPDRFVLKPGESTTLEMYRCPNCFSAFGQVLTVAGPKFCPACGAIFGLDLPCTIVDLLKVIDTCAPTELNTIGAPIPKDNSREWPLWVWIELARKFLRGAK
jgi:hypothetical protein